MPYFINMTRFVMLGQLRRGRNDGVKAHDMHWMNRKRVMPACLCDVGSFPRAFMSRGSHHVIHVTFFTSQ